MRIVFLATFLLCSLFVYGQSEQGKTDTTQQKVYTYVEQMPEPGYDIKKYLSEHLNYPDTAIKYDVQGRLILKFIVTETGDIDSVQVVKGIGGGCDEEAVRVLKGMPKWKAAINNGQAVKVWFTQPVLFYITEKDRINWALTFHVRLWPSPDYDVEKYIADHVQLPDSVSKNYIKGEVSIDFNVNQDGNISDCVVAKSLCNACDTEALRIISNMPQWEPNKYNDQAIKEGRREFVQFYLNPLDRIYQFVEQMPQAPYDLSKYLSENIHYPKVARRHRVAGRVIVKFIVTETGAIDDVHVIRGIGSGCDEEAARAIKNMPLWKAGKQNGKPVKVYFSVPIVFGYN